MWPRLTRATDRISPQDAGDDPGETHLRGMAGAGARREEMEQRMNHEEVGTGTLDNGGCLGRGRVGSEECGGLMVGLSSLFAGEI